MVAYWLRPRTCMKTCISDKLHDLHKVEGQARKVAWRVWQVLADKSRMKCPRSTENSGKVVHPTGNNAYQFQGQGYQAD